MTGPQDPAAASASPAGAHPAFVPPQVRWSGLTHVGRFRQNNEDRFIALNFDGRDLRYLGKVGEAPTAGTDFVFAVSDGMGGANSGEFASRITVDRVTRLLPRGFRLGASGIATGFNDLLSELFTSVHDDLIQLGAAYEECDGMGCTLSLSWFTPEWMYFGHIGDSRIYYFPRDGGMTQVTHDHSYVGTLRRRGEINEREARTHPRRNSLHQALGAGNQFIDPQIGAVGHRPGDKFLVCSDGLVDGLWDREIERIVRAPRTADVGVSVAHQLVESAVQSSGRDNTTAVFIEILAPAT